MKLARSRFRAASRLTGKARETIAKAAGGLPYSIGEKGSRLYNANSLMCAIYRRRDPELIWEPHDATDAPDEVACEKTEDIQLEAHG